MKLIGALILQNDNFVIDSHFELGFVGFFSRNDIKNLLLFFCKEISKKIKTNDAFHVVFDDKTNSYGCFKKFLDYTYCVLYDNEYPLQIIKKILFLYREKKLKSSYILKNYNDPNNVDDLKQFRDIQQKLNDTKQILYNTIEEVLDRGEKLETLVEKSTELSKSSKDFFDKSKKMNNCCGIF